MKLSLICVLVVVSSMSFLRSARAGEEITSQVQEEFKNMQAEFQAEAERVKKRVAELQAQREQIVATSKAKAEGAHLAIQLMKKYGLLISNRYVNVRGEYQSGLPLGQHDQDRINKLFSKYLQAIPLQGRVSAGEARRSLDWGVRRLQELSRIYAEPTELNNGELEMLALEVKEADGRIRKIMDAAAALSEEPVGHAVLPAQAEPQAQPQQEKRKPASHR